MLALVLLAASAAAQIVQFNAPTDPVSVCGQLSVTWGFDLGTLNDTTVFNLILAPADTTPTATTTFDNLTTVTPIEPPASSGSPGRREMLENLFRRDNARLTTVSPQLLIAQGGYTIAKVDAPAGSYVLDGSVDGDETVDFIPSDPFTVKDSKDESCVPVITTTSSTTSMSATSTPTDSGSSGGSQISAGAVAGAAIGGFLAALAIFAALFFLFCRRLLRKPPQPADAETPMTPMEGKGVRVDSTMPSPARFDSPAPPSLGPNVPPSPLSPPTPPQIPPQQRAELAAALEAAQLPVKQQ